MGLFNSRAFKAGKKAYKTASKVLNNQQQSTQQYPERIISSPIEDGKEFPYGIKGLIPLDTNYQKESFRCYLFSAENSNTLVEAAEAVNTIINDAEQLIKITLPRLTEINALPPKDLFTSEGSYWNFCRVEYSPTTKSGNENKLPLKLYLEVANTNDALTVSSVVYYDKEGATNKAKITCYMRDHYAWRPAYLHLVTIEAGTIRGTFLIKKITETRETSDSKLEFLLYDYRNK